MTISFNFLFFADPTDAVANNIFKKNSIADNSYPTGSKADLVAHSAQPHYLEGISPEDHVDVPASKGKTFG